MRQLAGVRHLSACVLLLVALLAGCGGDRSRPPAAADVEAIQSALRQFPNDFNAKDFPAMCALFTEDVVLNYPDGGPDRGREAFCTRMRKLLSDNAKQYTYAEPDIREVLVDGDLATVALTWTLTVRDPSGAVVEVIKEDGLDVFRRQPDGTWKIHISHGFALCRGESELPC